MTVQEQSAGNETYASALYSSLRSDLISGKYAPGEKLRTGSIRQRYKVGLSPVREALNRLAIEGFVTQSDHRGFAVAGVSRDDLQDLTRVRLSLNEMALRESIKHGDEVWEDSIAVALHRLSRAPRFAPAHSAISNPEWDKWHRAFHGALLAGSPSVRLRQYCDQLFDQSNRYRNLAAIISPKATIARTANEHREIFEATVKRDADRAVNLLRAHLLRTLDRLLANWHHIKDPSND